MANPDLTAELTGFLANQEQMAHLAASLRDVARAADPAPTVDGHDPVDDVPPPGTRIRYFGDYELLEEIARGGMGPISAVSYTGI